MPALRAKGQKRQSRSSGSSSLRTFRTTLPARKAKSTAIAALESSVPLPIDCEEKEQKALDARLLAVQQQVTDEGIINSEGIDVQPENARRGNISLPRLLVALTRNPSSLLCL